MATRAAVNLDLSWVVSHNSISDRLQTSRWASFEGTRDPIIAELTPSAPEICGDMLALGRIGFFLSVGSPDNPAFDRRQE